MNELQVFNNKKFGNIRTISINGKPYFVGADVAKALGYKDTTNAIKQHCKGVVKRHIPTNGGNQLMNVIPKGDIYRLAANSELPGAEEFESWIFDEVLVSIDNHGAYLTPEKIEEVLSDPDTIIKLAMTLKEEKQKRLLAEQQAESLAVQLDESKHWYTIKRVAQLNRIGWKTLDWKLLKSQSQRMGLNVDKIFDANFGTVNTYHEDVWKAVYPTLVY